LPGSICAAELADFLVGDDEDGFVFAQFGALPVCFGMTGIKPRYNGIHHSPGATVKTKLLIPALMSSISLSYLPVSSDLLFSASGF